jgi:hypothetical protein
MNATTPPEWRSYEEVTADLVRRLGSANGITTLRLERDVLLSGRATDNRIDVLWEFQRASSQPVRVLFECRSYARRINQQALHSWRSVVDDVAEPGVETIGVMVTTTGYQSGAQRVADSYGIVILELRTPTEQDLANRWRSVRVDFVARMPQVSDLAVDVTEQLGPDASVHGALGEFFLDFEDGSSERLMDHVLRGELASLEEPPTEPHPVRRTFATPVLLRHGREPVARVVAIRATVSETHAAPIVMRRQLQRSRGCWLTPSRAVTPGSPPTDGSGTRRAEWVKRRDRAGGRRGRVGLSDRTWMRMQRHMTRAVMPACGVLANETHCWLPIAGFSALIQDTIRACPEADGKTPASLVASAHPDRAWSVLRWAPPVEASIDGSEKDGCRGVRRRARPVADGPGVVPRERDWP